MARGPLSEASGNGEYKSHIPTINSTSPSPIINDQGPEEEEEDEVIRRREETSLRQCPFGKREREGEESAIIPYKIGQHIDVLDSVERWAEAKVLKIDLDNRRIYVSFLYWSHLWDTWVDDVGTRCSYLHTHTYTPGGVLRLNQRLDVLDENNKWLEAFVLDASPAEVLIHFKGFNKKFDVWLPRNSPRIRQFGFGVNKRNRTIIPQKIWAVPGSSKSITVDRTRKIAIASDNYAEYSLALKQHGLEVCPVAGDGNCLFRSVAHQLYGNDDLHDLVRAKCMDYMEANAPYFAMFVEGGIENFHLYLSMKRELACWGDDPEIQAMCEIYGRRAEIWAYDHIKGAKRLRTYHEMTAEHSTPIAIGSSSSGDRSSTISLSFYGGGHYDSIVGPSFTSHLLPTMPGLIEDAAIYRARSMAANERLRSLDGGGGVGSTPTHSPGSGARATHVEAVSDTKETEDAEIELALSSSRREMELFGEEDIETCLALSLSSYDAQSKYGATGSSGSLDGVPSTVPRNEMKDSSSSSAADSKTGRSGSISNSRAIGDAVHTDYNDFELDDKAILEFYLKQSADEHTTYKECNDGVSTGGGSRLGHVQSEEEAIEAQILEQARQESLQQHTHVQSAGAIASDVNTASSRNSDEYKGDYSSATTPTLGVGQDELALAIDQSEQEMLEQALRMSTEATTSQSNSYGSRSVPPVQIVVDELANSEEEMLRMAIMQSVESTNNSGSLGWNQNNSTGDDEEEDMSRAIATSMQDR